MRHNRRDDGQLSCRKREMKTMNANTALDGHTTVIKMAERGGVPLLGYKTLPQIFLIITWGLSYGLSKSKKRGKIITKHAKLWKIVPRQKLKKIDATFWRSALLLSFCENRFCPSQLIKKLNSTERGALFWHFSISKVITTAHAHKSGVIFHIFPRAFKQKKLRLYDQRWGKN